MLAGAQQLCNADRDVQGVARGGEHRSCAN